MDKQYQNQTESVGLPDMISPIVKNQIAELNKLIEKYPTKIPTDKAAKFLKMDIECLRKAIEQNRVPFALGCEGGVGTKRYSYVSSVTFYLWYISPLLHINM